jgi:hypothetical protein
MIVYVALLVFVIAIAYVWKTKPPIREPYAAAPDKASPMTFTQVPVDKTYAFATPIPADASEFDKMLGKVTDERIPAVMVDGAGEPEPSPYTDSEVQRVVEAALGRLRRRGTTAARGTTALRYIVTDYATKRVDKLGNSQFDIAFMAYDMIKNFNVKIALVALVTKSRKTFVKTFKSFNRKDDDPNAPVGTDKFGGQDGNFVNDLGIDYAKLYG